MSSGQKKWGLGILLTLILIYIFNHFSLSDFFGKTANAAPDVIVTKAKQENAQVIATAIGNISSFNTVEIKSLVNGELMSVGFSAGDFVKQGQILFKIDPRPYEVKLLQAKAQLEKDQAEFVSANDQVIRNKALLPNGYVSKDLFDQLLAKKNSLQATITQDQASISNAELELSYCTITAPIAGKTGDVLVDQGNIIQSNSTKLVTINQLDPVYAVFSLPQQYLPAILEEFKPTQPFPVYTKVDNVNLQGNLSFINNTVDSTTGSIQLKATFNNSKLQLWPGQFVKLSIPIKHLTNALIIPLNAVLSGQQGAYVYIIKNHTAFYRTVELGPVVQQGQVIEKGLNVNDVVVVNGQSQLNDGMPVNAIALSKENS